MDIIEDYIEKHEHQEELRKVRKIFQECLPECTEKIAWGMPTYHKNHNIIHFASNKKHLGIYPGADGIEAFKDAFDKHGYGYSKGAGRIPYDSIDEELLKEMARWCLDHHQ
jgi:uncharacterized protein YdhG (YjbR/CyaY superfamily)